MNALEAEIRKAVADGYKTFLYGEALGVDTWAAQIVLQLKEKLPLTLIAVLRFPDEPAENHTTTASRIIGISLLRRQSFYTLPSANRLARSVGRKETQRTDGSLCLLSVVFSRPSTLESRTIYYRMFSAGIYFPNTLESLSESQYTQFRQFVSSICA